MKKQLEEVNQKIEKAERDSDFGKAAELKYGNLTSIQKQIKDEQELIDKNSNGSQLVKEEISEQDIAFIVSRWTGIPVNKLLEGEVDKLLRIGENLHRRVIGQEEAIEAVASAIQRARVGLNDPNKPIGSFIF